ncbi:PREDICTED: extracellular calcium-sensing receptor-like [Nanorana parkeri]|uniref:extracellular calcium-sensing receptor-like n=1 Tax=Nanorana parkeri TaxID=125878 RepID=UPI0008548DDD|nr:PREDICTED: extracellular calcium-sensing receptor-like [Nanorana parkeri]
MAEIIKLFPKRVKRNTIKNTVNMTALQLEKEEILRNDVRARSRAEEALNGLLEVLQQAGPKVETERIFCSPPYFVTILPIISQSTVHRAGGSPCNSNVKMRFCIQLGIVILPLCYIRSLASRCLLSKSLLADYTEEGDITLGMINPIRATLTQTVFTFSSRPAPRSCDLFISELYKSILALLFATKEVNDNPDLLPNITLGFQMYDSCFFEATSLQATIQLLYYLKRVYFINTAGEAVSFDANGDMYGYFDIMNWHIKGNNGQHVRVGIFNENINASEKLDINVSAIYWYGGPGKVPSSICSEVCLPGYWKAPLKGQPVCCFDCKPCSEGTISNQTNSVACYVCPEDRWPNSLKTECIPKAIEFLSYEEPLGLVMALFSIFFSVITLIVLYIYFKFRDTVVVKANNRSLSYLILLSLNFCFLCSLVFIGYPTRLTCTVRRFLFAVTFSFCVSCILAKTIIVVIAFEVTKPGSNLRVWLGFRTAIIIITISTSIQMVIILVWLARFPPFLEHNYHVMVGTTLVECNEGSVAMFYCTLGYLSVLAVISYVVAFLARNLPDSFNEAKYITFSMLTFLSVWSTFIPAYLSTKGKYIVAVEVFAILLSSFGLLCCIFFPKCYIILLKPSMNNRGYLASRSK